MAKPFPPATPAHECINRLNSPTVSQPPSNTPENTATRLRQFNGSREKWCALIAEWLPEALEPILIELENLAAGTTDHELQLRYLRLRQDAEDHWPVFCNAVIEKLRKLTGQLPDNDFQMMSVQSENLHLVEEEELAEQFVIREFAARLTESCNQEIYGLEQRVATLLGRETPPSAEDNPLGPGKLCHALSEASTALECVHAERELRPLLLRRLEQPLHQSLPDIYHQLNEYLIRLGILPEIKQAFRRKPPDRSTARAHGKTPDADGKTSDNSTDVLNAIQQLAARVGKDQNLIPGQADIAPPPALQNPAFASTLRELQQIDWNSLPSDSPADANLIWQVRKSEAASKVGHIEAATIDIVAMLFDFIFEDKALSTGVKALVGRLQIPVLKIALQDRNFFASREHPARYFLDDISAISIRWGGDILSDDPFYRKLENLVTRIQQEFAEDIAIFSQAIEELAAFVDERDTEAKPALTAVAETASQREEEIDAAKIAREAAHTKAEAAVKPWLDKRIYPPILDFYEIHWLRVLESITLDADSSEADWNSAVAFMDDLAWSISMHSHRHRSKLIALVPQLLATIQKGLDRIHITQEERQPFLDMLYEIHSANMKAAFSGPQPEPEARYIPPPPNDADGHGGMIFTRYVSRGIEVEEITLAGKLPLDRDEYYSAQALVQALQRGDWIEFQTGSEDAFRATLKWVSPKKGLLIFMQHHDNKAVSISPDALTVQLRDGAAVLIEGESIFERAINNVVNTLKNSPEGVEKFVPDACRSQAV